MNEQQATRDWSAVYLSFHFLPTSGFLSSSQENLLVLSTSVDRESILSQVLTVAAFNLAIGNGSKKRRPLRDFTLEIATYVRPGAKSLLLMFRTALLTVKPWLL